MNTELTVAKARVAEQKSNLYATAGEEVGYETGAKMVKNYYDKNNRTTATSFLGKDMLESILAQPGAVGISVLNGLNEQGQPQPVVVAVNAKGDYILNITTVDVRGGISRQKGIVAIGVMSPGKETTPTPCCSWWA